MRQEERAVLGETGKLAVMLLMASGMTAWLWPSEAGADPLVGRGAEWLYQEGTSEASNPVEEWRQPSFADGEWERGEMPFYYGEEFASGTILSDMINSYSSLYLRKTFVVDDVEGFETLLLRVRVDDGVVAWLNGREVARFNVPEGEPTYRTLAEQAVDEPIFFREFYIEEAESQLVEGTNVLAVQAFNDSEWSSDLVVDVELETTVLDIALPVLSRVLPKPGPVPRLGLVNVTFSEAVGGVNASDLLANGQPALEVTGGGAKYSFRLAKLDRGLIEMTWAEDHGIADFSQRSNPFKGEEPSATWTYFLTDLEGPRLVELVPFPDADVPELQEVRVVFDEPVTGVDAEDLLFNGQPGLASAGAGAGPYQFLPPENLSGWVQMEWAVGHGIRDGSSNQNPMEGSTWRYFVGPQPARNPLIATNATWRFQRGSQEPSDPAELWRNASELPEVWELGLAPFHYGSAGAAGKGTELQGMFTNYTSVAFWKPFRVEDAGVVEAMELRTLVDDGFIAWINGVEVQRHNMGAGEVPYDGLAALPAVEPREWNVLALPEPRHYLKDGVNVIAVQVFNVEPWSSDFLFAAELNSVEPDLEPPTVFRVWPEPGEVHSLTQIEVLFSEPVVGVEAADLLVNGTPALAVTGTGDRFTFSLPAGLLGNVTVAWRANHTIVDLARPANSLPSGQLQARYHVADRLSPEVASIHPYPQITVRQLDRVRINFTEPVAGLDAADLLANGTPASEVTGSGAGPYWFEWAEQIPAGPVAMRWEPGHGIIDRGETPNAFAGGDWEYQLEPGLPPGRIQIHELVAVNQTILPDEDGGYADVIELFNPGAEAVDLSGWSLSDDPDQLGQWIFPEISMEPGSYLVLFASGKDRRPADGELHTNFRLSSEGEFLGLFDGSEPRVAVDMVGSALGEKYPEQRVDVSYGRKEDGSWVYFAEPSPGRSNEGQSLSGTTKRVKFNVERGFFNEGFDLYLSCSTPGARIFYTTDGSLPQPVVEQEYQEPLHIDKTTIVRAMARADERLPSKVETHTYFVGLDEAIYTLPVLSISTDNNNLWGPTGIMEVNPRNTTKHGIAWERPVSAELIETNGQSGFQIDAGLRVHGGGWIRAGYDPNGIPPRNKYSFRLYFRGDYGEKQLDYPLFPDAAVEKFDRVVLRAGMNDHTDPFIVDELVRRLFADTGNVSSLGTVVNLFLNGEYKGYYNPTERIDRKFLQAWFGGGEDWDVIKQYSQVHEGDGTAWVELNKRARNFDLNSPAHYQEVARRLDLVNFADYLLVSIYCGMQDWPHNNWRAARERVEGSKFRFFVWDAEWAFGYESGVEHNTVKNELAGDTEIGHLFRNLMASSEFRLLMADRVQKHFFNGGALSDEHVMERYLELRSLMAGMLPYMNEYIDDVWVPQRRQIVFDHLREAGLFASDLAPQLSAAGGRYAPGFRLKLDAPQGGVYYTLDGSDPRLPFGGGVAPSAILYSDDSSGIELSGDVTVHARTLSSGSWSALTKASFAPARTGPPLRITEVNYNPPGGHQFEFLELQNISSRLLDVGKMSFEGINYIFPDGATLASGDIWLLVSNDDVEAFQRRYPGVSVDGTFGRRLSNGGEGVELRDRTGQRVLRVAYDDEDGWPASADGGGHSLELADFEADFRSPTAWRQSQEVGGSPGKVDSTNRPVIQVAEVMAAGNDGAGGGPAADWVEIWNRGNEPADLGGWILGDHDLNGRFVFPSGTVIPAGGRLVVWCALWLSDEALVSGFELSGKGGGIFLFDLAGSRVDGLSFGSQASGYSLGWFEQEGWQLASPTPGEQNLRADDAGYQWLRINEWLANPETGGSDWVEIFNQHAEKPVALRGLSVSNGEETFTTPAHSFVGPREMVLLRANGEHGPMDLHLSFSKEGGAIELMNVAGETIDRVDYEAQPEGFSSGRFPDGEGDLVLFHSAATPGEPNVEPRIQGPVFNEVLVRGERGAAGWIELFNPQNEPFDLSGYRIALGSESPNWLIPYGTQLEPMTHLVVALDPNQPESTMPGQNLNTGFGIPLEGAVLQLLNSEQRLVDTVTFGFQIPGRAIGRSSGSNNEIGDSWALLAKPTPAGDNAVRAELGDPFELVFNEWRATNVDGEFDWFELYNRGNLPVAMAGMHVTDDPSIAGREKFEVRPLTFIDARNWIVWQADDNPAFGHVTFKLAATGEALRLYHADGQWIDGVDFGLQTEGSSVGRYPDGADQIQAFPNSATPGTSNRPATAVEDRDGDGMPDQWELSVGLDPLNPRDANLDSDGDGSDNLAEFRSGTDPRDSQDVLGFLRVTRDAQGTAMEFHAQAGRRYLVQYCESLEEATWRILSTIEAGEQDRLIQVTDSPASPDSYRFYRLGAHQQAP